MQELITRAKELLENGTVARVLGWKKGEHNYDPEVAFFHDAQSLENFVYNGKKLAETDKEDWYFSYSRPTLKDLFTVK